LDGLEIWTGEIAHPTIARATAPPLTRVAEGIGFAKNGDHVTLLYCKIDTLDSIVRCLGSEVVQNAAELKLVGVKFAISKLWIGLQSAALFFLLASGKSFNKLAHKIWEAEYSE
jgi:hypothetical protein